MPPPITRPRIQVTCPCGKSFMTRADLQNANTGRGFFCTEPCRIKADQAKRALAQTHTNLAGHSNLRQINSFVPDEGTPRRPRREFLKYG